MKRIATGLGALVVLAVMLVGVPVALTLVAGNPLPTAAQLEDIITLSPDYGNQLLLTKFLPLVGWIAWLMFAGPFLVELIAAIRGITVPRSRLFGGFQALSAGLIAAVLSMFLGATTLTASPAAAAAAESTSVSSTSAPTVAVSPPAPAPQTAAPEPAATPVQVQEQRVVQPGDTLWGIAAEELGDGAKYPEIFNASAGTMQPDNAQLQDPNIIRPGWNLTIPTTEIAPTPPAPADVAPPAPAPPADAAPPAPVDVSAPADAPETAPDEATGPAGTNTDRTAVDERTDRTDQLVGDDQADDLVVLRTIGGIGGLLAAGLLAALGRRRMTQRRKRRTGERIALPAGEIGDMELELRMVEDPFGADDIDQALRLLQVWSEDTETDLPKIFAVRLEGAEIAFYLTEPADLPEPFEAASDDHTAWLLRPGTLPETVRSATSPYPALAAIGEDARNGTLLLDLEQLGAISVVGDQDAAKALLNSLAVELAESSWSNETLITLVGMPDGLASEVNQYRVRHVDDIDTLMTTVRADLADTSAALASWGAEGVHQGRTTPASGESWAPQVIILGETPDPAIQQELTELVMQIPRMGLAAIANGHLPGGSVLNIESAHKATLTVAGVDLPPLPFAPQQLAGRELELIQAMFAVSTQDAVAAATPDQTPPHRSDPDSVEVLHRADPTAATTAGTADRPAQEEISSIDEHRPADEPVHENLQLDARPPAPYIRMLGPVSVENLTEATNMPGRGVEFLAYLHLHPGADGPQVQQAFWPTSVDASDSQRGTARKVRDAIGHAPDGTPWFPRNTDREGYRLHAEIRSDWTDFLALIGPSLPDTSNENLVKAIRLIRGQPFTGINTRRGWWKWVTPMQEEEMRASLIDATDELARRALAANDLLQARSAARMAQYIEPVNEEGWRNEMRAAWGAGDIGELQTIVSRLNSFLDSFGEDYDMEPETHELVVAAMRDLDVA